MQLQDILNYLSYFAQKFMQMWFPPSTLAFKWWWYFAYRIDTVSQRTETEKNTYHYIRKQERPAQTVQRSTYKGNSPEVLDII